MLQNIFSIVCRNSFLSPSTLPITDRPVLILQVVAGTLVGLLISSCDRICHSPVIYNPYVPVRNIASAPTSGAGSPPLKRENRLYQADWLIRLYGFSIDDVITEKAPNLDLSMDPKQASAYRHPELFPVDINTAGKEMILRVPGIGIKSANRIVALDNKKAMRVWKGLKSHLGNKARQMLADAFLSGKQGVETMIYLWIRERIPDRNGGKNKARHGVKIRLDQLARKVRQEAHRLKGLIRFERTGDNQYFARVAPRYDVLPLIRGHFESRFADQRWIIYDSIRRYGLFFNGKNTGELSAETGEQTTDMDGCSDEAFCQRLWKRYYQAVNIPARDNPRLHCSLLPRRYWEFLTEKKERFFKEGIYEKA